MYYNLLPKIKNASLVKKEAITTPFSAMDFAVLKILKEHKYIKDVQKVVANKKSFLEVKLLYTNGKPAFSDFKIISKPSQQIYKGYKELRLVKGGYGLGVISTPKGVMAVQEARKNKVGGKYLFEVW